MSDQLYRGLARRLDSIPPGFPASESGVELELLARLYTPEEAAIATAMRLNYEPAGTIAKRAATDPDAAYDILCAAARKGLVRTRTRDGERTFALIPETSGFTGFSTPAAVRHDAKAAELYVRWIQETQGGSLSDAPAARRVIPIEESISFGLAIHPYEQASEMLATARSWGVLDCMCRTRTRLAGQGCNHLLEACLVFAPDEGAYDDDELIRAISLEESLRILREAADEGLVHTTGNYGDHDFIICNCCPCCCSLLRGVVQFHRPTVVAHSDFRATVDETACQGCGDCLERCHFAALSLRESVCVVSAHLPVPSTHCRLGAALRARHHHDPPTWMSGWPSTPRVVGYRSPSSNSELMLGPRCLQGIPVRRQRRHERKAAPLFTRCWLVDRNWRRCDCCTVMPTAQAGQGSFWDPAFAENAFKANLTKLAFCGIFVLTSKDLAMAVIRNSSA